jgi:hypothetical protein
MSEPELERVRSEPDLDLSTVISGCACSSPDGCSAACGIPLWATTATAAITRLQSYASL